MRSRTLTLLALILLLVINTAQAAGITSRMSLTDAIESVRGQGIEISYSSSLVEPWMRVRETPSSEDALQGLAEALAVYGLALKEQSQNQWLIVAGAPYTPPGLDENKAVVAATIDPQDLRPQIDEIKIIASRYGMYSWDASTEQFLSGEDIRLLPHIADDVFRAFHRLPGVAANDFSAPFNLRGGTVDEVKVMLDGLELFEPYHMRTLFNPLSIIDPGIIDNVSVLSGGYTVENGNHMSGVIDISSKWETGRPVHEMGVSFLNAFIRSSGRMGERGSYQVSARRGYLDLLADSVAVGDEDFSPRYSDIYAKAGYAISDSTYMEAHVMLASDSVDFENPQEDEKGDSDGSLKYAWLVFDTDLNDRVRWTNLISMGKTDHRDTGNSRNWPAEYIDRDYQRDVDVSSIKSDLNLRLSENHLWMFGMRYRNLKADFDYHIDSFRQSDFYNYGIPLIIRRDTVTSRDGGELGVYARYRFRPTQRSAWELGLRWDKQTYTNTGDDSQLSPRVNALFNLSEQTDLRASWGYYYQPQRIHQLQVEDGIDHYFPASRAEQLVAGIRHRFASDIELQLDIYQKKYTDLRPRYENALDAFEYAPESDFDRVLIEPEHAKSLGLEMTLRDRRADNFDWWLSYTWSKAEDYIDGVAVPRSWDQRHAITASLSWRFKDWVLGVVGRYHSGWPRTELLLIPIVDDSGSLVGFNGDLSQRNLSNYKDYHRVDMRLSRTFELQQSSIQIYLELFNVFNIENECCVAGHELSAGSPITASPNYDAYLPFFPSFGFVWTFGPGVNQVN